MFRCVSTSQDLPPLDVVQDIVQLLLQYLQDEGYTASLLTLQDEANVRLAEQQTQRSIFKRMRKAILGMYHMSSTVGACRC